MLQAHQDNRGIAFKIHVLGLAAMVAVTREEIARAERFALVLVDQEAAAHLFLH